MENNQIKRRIGAFIKTLLNLSIAQGEVVEYDLNAIMKLVDNLHSELPQENELYIKVQNDIGTLMKTDYVDFTEAGTVEEMEQALIQIKYKITELGCNLQLSF